MIVRFNRVRKPLQRFGILIGISLLIYQGWNGFLAVQIATLPPQAGLLITIGIGLIFLAIGQQVLAWWLLMKGLHASLPFLPAVRGYTLSFLPRYIPGTIWGYLSRSEWLYQDFAIDFSLSSIGSFVEITMGLLAGLWMVGWNFIARKTIIWQLGWILILFILPWILQLMINKGYSIQILNQRIFKNFINHPYKKQEYLYWLGSLVLIVTNWFYYGAALYLCCLALGVPVQGFSSGLWISFSIEFTISWLVGFMVFFLPAGLGLRETILATLLSNNLGLLSNQASGAAVVLRLVVISGELTWVGAAAIMLLIARRKN